MANDAHPMASMTMSNIAGLLFPAGRPGICRLRFAMYWRSPAHAQEGDRLSHQQNRAEQIENEVQHGSASHPIDAGPSRGGLQEMTEMWAGAALTFYGKLAGRE
jgi:hypothetical protein